MLRSYNNYRVLWSIEKKTIVAAIKFPALNNITLKVVRLSTFVIQRVGYVQTLWLVFKELTQ